MNVKLAHHLTCSIEPAKVLSQVYAGQISIAEAEAQVSMESLGTFSSLHRTSDFDLRYVTSAQMCLFCTTFLIRRASMCLAIAR